MRRYAISAFVTVVSRLAVLILIAGLSACGEMVHMVASRPVALVGADDQLHLVETAPYIAKWKTIRGDGAEFDIFPMNDIVDSSHSFILFIPFDKRGRSGPRNPKGSFIVYVDYKLAKNVKWDIIDPYLVFDVMYKPKVYKDGCFTDIIPQHEITLPYTFDQTESSVRCVRFSFPVQTPEPEKSFTINFGYLEIKGGKVPFTVIFGPARYTSGGG